VKITVICKNNFHKQFVFFSSKHICLLFWFHFLLLYFR
jgi:hypothetical protein